MVRDMRATAYDIPEGCCAGYDPECNPLIPWWHHAEGSNTPAAKSIPVRVRPACSKSLSQLRERKRQSSFQSAPSADFHRVNRRKNLHPPMRITPYCIQPLSEAIMPTMQTRNPVSSANLMGHPLHPILITLPIGLFAATFLFDLIFWQTGNAAFATGASAAWCRPNSGSAGGRHRPDPFPAYPRPWRCMSSMPSATSSWC